MQSFASLLTLSPQAPQGSCFPRRFHLFRWPFRTHVSAGVFAATLCGWLPQETSYRRRKCHIAHAWWYRPPCCKPWLLPWCCRGRVAVSGVTVWPDTKYLQLESFSALAPVLYCGSKWCLPLFRKSAKTPAETFHFQPKLVLICSRWLGLLCPSEMCLIHKNTRPPPAVCCQLPLQFCLSRGSRSC